MICDRLGITYSILLKLGASIQISSSFHLVKSLITYHSMSSTASSDAIFETFYHIMKKTFLAQKLFRFCKTKILYEFFGSRWRHRSNLLAFIIIILVLKFVFLVCIICADSYEWLPNFSVFGHVLSDFPFFPIFSDYLIPCLLGIASGGNSHWP